MSNPIDVNSLVQWISGGVFMFDTPKRVQRIIDDPDYGKYVWVYGSSTGIPYDELIPW